MNNLEKISEQAKTQTGATDLQKISQGTYYSPDHLRSIVYSCNYNGQPAILKVYNDPREIHEPTALAAFNKINKSKVLRAPLLYASAEIDAQSGWLLMEQIPSSAQPFERLMDAKTRKEFLKVFLEYRQNFPTACPYEISLPEHLSAANFYLYRINRWFELAGKKDSNHFMQNGQHLYDPKILAAKLQQSMEIIRKVFHDRPMLWSHGHFNNREVFRDPAASRKKRQYYLLDFGSCKNFPQGYEITFIIWVDYIMSENWKNTNPQEWLVGIEDWLKDAFKIARRLKYPAVKKLIYTSLLERTWGTILADVMAAEKPLEEKQARLKLLFSLVDFCLEKLG